jgi:hypothetical protein
MRVHGRDFRGGLDFSTDFEGFASPRINNFDLLYWLPGKHIPTTYLQELGSSSSSPTQFYPLPRLLIFELSSDLPAFPYTLFWYLKAQGHPKDSEERQRKIFLCKPYPLSVDSSAGWFLSVNHMKCHVGMNRPIHQCLPHTDQVNSNFVWWPAQSFAGMSASSLRITFELKVDFQRHTQRKS